jgi:hypothetical protein
VSGDQVTVAGHLVNTNANGIWIATVTDPNTFTIPVAGNGAGGATGTARKTAYNDLNAILTDSVIFSWDLVPYMYGDVEFLDLQFMLRVREMYVQHLDI